MFSACHIDNDTIRITVFAFRFGSIANIQDLTVISPARFLNLLTDFRHIVNKKTHVMQPNIIWTAFIRRIVI